MDNIALMDNFKRLRGC